MDKNIGSIVAGSGGLMSLCQRAGINITSHILRRSYNNQLPVVGYSSEQQYSTNEVGSKLSSLRIRNLEYYLIWTPV